MSDQILLIPFGQRVRQLLGEQKWSNAELAKRSHLPPSLVSRLLGGKRKPAVKHGLAIAQAFSMSLGQLVLETDAVYLLRDNVPMQDFNREVDERVKAQTEVACLQAELGSLRAEREMLNRAVAELEETLAGKAQELVRTKESLRKEQLLRTLAGQEKAQALLERNEERSRADDNYRAWYQLNRQLVLLRESLAKEKNLVKWGWLTTFLGTLGGMLVGASLPDGSGNSSSSRKRIT